MPKSNYPNKLDTSVEIPVVRDNITEIGSDVLNSIRSAIFKIEQTLGINPQGAAGNTVSNRLNSALDESGNILKEALDKAGFVSGPIIDSDVSKVAAIQESKLKLNYPTQVLQSEISILNSQIDEIIEKIAEIAAQLSAHINLNSLNRHNAFQINIEEALANPSDDAAGSLEAEDVQLAMERVYNGHVNYTGVNISESNNSHVASQVFYNKELTSDVVSGDDVQTAIDDIANIGVTGLRNAILNMHSNGIIRSGSIVDDFEGADLATTLLDESAISFGYSSGTKTAISLSSPIEPNGAISSFDTLIISGTYEGDEGGYPVSIVTYDGGKVIEVEIFGNLKNDSASTATARIVKNTYSLYNQNSLNCTVRTRSDHTSTPDVQIANPNSATIISFGLRSENIALDSSSFDISIDGGSAITIYTYDDSISTQTIDSIITMINDQSVSQHLNFMAYKVRMPSCYEIAIAHNLPNSATDHMNRTIKISSGSDKDGSIELGFEAALDVVTEGSYGNSYHINGYIHNDFGKIIQLSVEDLYFIQGSSRLSLISQSAIETGIRVGDLLIVSGSSDESDDGTYRVASVSGNAIFTDDSSSSFAGEITSSTIIFIVRTTGGVGELTFTEDVASDGVIIFDCFINEAKEPNFSRRLEVDGALRTSGFMASVTDVSRNFITSGEVANIAISMDGYATLTDPVGQVGDPVFVATDGEYYVYSADQLSFVVIKVFAALYPAMSLSVDIYGFDEIARDNLFLCRGVFGPTLGRVFGEAAVPGSPVLIDKRDSGTTDKTIISPNIIEKYIEGPRNELRSSGVVRGAEVSGHSSYSGVDSAGDPLVYQEVNISSGIVYVNGIRFEILGHESFRVNLEEDFYIGLNNEGCIVAEPDPESDGYASSPFYSQIVAHLAFVHIADSTIEDLRFFVDHLDYKLVSDITVAMDQRFGHFTSVEKAVDYARRFSYLFPTMPTPTILIKEGTYDVRRQLLLDFDVKVSGVGSQTILRRDSSLTDPFLIGYSALNKRMALDYSLFLIGGGPTSSSDRIENGVSLENFSYESPDFEPGRVNVMIGVSQAFDGSHGEDSPVIRVKEVNFVGSVGTDWGSATGYADWSAGTTDDTPNGESFLAYMQQVDLSTDPISLTGSALGGLNTINICNLEVIGCRISRPSPVLAAIVTFWTSTIPVAITILAGTNITIRDNVVTSYMSSLMSGRPSEWTSDKEYFMAPAYGLWTPNLVPTTDQGCIFYKDNLITTS